MKEENRGGRRSKGGNRNPRKGGPGLTFKIMDHFERNERKRYDAPQLAKKLKLKISYAEIDQKLGFLASKGKLKASGGGTYKLAKKGRDETQKITPPKDGFIGRVDMTRSGDAFIIIDGMESDVFVQGRRLKFAMNGDLVKVELKRGGGRRKLEGAVVEIVERKRDKFLGTLRNESNQYFVETEDQYLALNIEVKEKYLKAAKEGDLVVVKITKWPKKRNDFPKGEIVQVLGGVGSNEITMQQILLNQGFDPGFAPELEEQAAMLKDGAKEKKPAWRKDYRKEITFTIDPETAKDFDDALSVKFLPDGLCEIGIHIADVTHYIQPGSLLDKEAFSRSTSVYLVDRVAPMLPEKLSNELCSLRPNEDKCTFSAIFTFDAEDTIVKKWFGKTLTHSDRRFTYEEAQEVIKSGKGDHAKELKKLNRMAEKMRANRFKKGAINFESDEVKFKLDEEGVPLEVFVKERFEAHLLVEEFMLLANREVAGFMVEKGKEEQEYPFVYRVHDYPDPERVADFTKFAMELGLKLDTSSPAAIAKSFNMLSKASDENNALRMLGPMAIRTMAKAIYTTENIGHYGLAFNNYAHFTSPIRRYADVLVHRILFKNLTEHYRMDKSVLESMCKHISAQEKKAAEAERESIKYKLVEFMETRVGQIFDGYVTGMIDRGIFVELVGVKAEGMVGFENMSEPFAVADSHLKARGKRTNRIIKMGDKIRVKVLSADLSTRRIELEEIGTEKEE